METNAKQLWFSSRMDNSKLKADAQKAKEELKGIGDTAVAEGAKIENSFSKGLALIGGTAAITMLGKQILDTTAKFEKFGIVLKNTLGDTQGAAALDMISNFAATTPFQLDEVTGAFIKMANQGFVPTRDEMVKLGDLASSTGKGFDQLGEALLDAQTGQFERLKEFGIKASANGDKVTFSFKEQQTTVENTNSAIQKYILSLGDLKGIVGANALISASLTGQISNLSDKLDAMYNQIGSANKGILYAAVGGVTSLVENYETIGKILMGLVVVYGTYKAAVIIQNAVMTETAAINAMVAASNGVLSTSLAYQWVWTERQTAAQAALNRAMLLSPYVALTALVVALGYGIYKLITYATDAEKAQKKLNEAIGESDKNIEAESLQIDALFSRLKAAKEGTEEYGAAKAAIFAKYGEQLSLLGNENTALNNIALAHDTITEAAKKSARARGLAKITNEASNTTAEIKGDARTSISQLLQDKFKGQKGSDGVGIPETYFVKIVPVIEGKAEITKEIEDIVKLFDKGTSIGTTQNPLRDQIEKVTRAKSIFDKTMAEAIIKFGEAPAVGKEKPFNSALLSLQELMRELPKATEQLNALQKAENKDAGKITSQDSKVASIKSEIAAREKQLYIINDVEAQLKNLQNTQKKYGVNDTEYKDLENRITALKAKLPDNSKKEIDQIKAVSDAMKIAIGKDLDLLAEKLVALEKINDAQEQAVSDAKGRVYGKARKAEDERLLGQIDNPSAEMIPVVRPVVSEKIIKNTKQETLEVDKLNKGIAQTNTEVKSLKQKLTSEESIEYLKELNDQIYNIADGAAILSRAFEGSNAELSKMFGDMSKFAGGAADLMKGISTGDPVAVINGMVNVYKAIQSAGGDMGSADRIAGLEKVNALLSRQQELIDKAARSGSEDTARKSELEALQTKLQTLNANRDEAQSQLDKIRKQWWNLSQLIFADRKTLKAEIDQNNKDIEETQKAIDQAKQDLIDFNAYGITQNTLADSIAQAFQDGKGSVKDFGEYTNKILKDAVIEAFKANILGDELTNAQKLISDAFADKTLSADDVTNIKTSMQQAADSAKLKWDALSSALPDLFSSDSTRSASSKGFASMSQDTGNELNGRFTAIQGHTFSISEGVKILQSNSEKALQHLAGIEVNTARLEAIQNGIDTINLKGIILKN